MRSFREVRIGTVALGVLLLCGAPVLAASSVALTVELGGDNHAAQWKAGTKQAFSGGSTAGGQSFPQGSLMTWDVRVTASGTQGSGAGAGQPIYGAANVVFNLELRDASNNLVAVNPFKSTINDGTGSDVLAAAAFAVGFNVSGAPGRCVDPTTAGGPLMGGVDSSQWKVRSATYPKAVNGQLLGMGAGYSPPAGATKSWVAAQMKAGVGMATLPNSQPGLGTGPVFEGQIDTSMLAQGTYTLTIVPRPGINVLRGDVDLTTDQNSFATAAESTSGSSIQFAVAPPLPPPAASNPDPANGATQVGIYTVLSWTPGAGATSRDVYFGTINPPPLVGNQTETTFAPTLEMDKTYYWRVDERNAGGPTTGQVWSFSTVPALRAIAWRSIRTHSGVGDLAITLNAAKSIGGALTQGPTSESRRGGVRKIQVQFTKAIADPFAPSITDSNGQAVTPSSMTVVAPDTLEFVFDAGVLSDQQCYKIDLTSAIFDIDFTEEISGDIDCPFRNLQGDVTQDGQVNVVDMANIKSKVNQTVTASIAKLDVNLNGKVETVDMALCKSLLNHTACK